MDDADFTRIDQMVFDRLHRGPLAPVIVHLKEGATVTGEVLAIHRSGAVGGSEHAPAGELCLAVESGRITVRYDQISDIS